MVPVSVPSHNTSVFSELHSILQRLLKVKVDEHEFLQPVALFVNVQVTVATTGNCPGFGFIGATAGATGFAETGSYP